MKNAIFNKIITIDYPDDFYEMSEDEIKRFFGGDMLRFGVRNLERHIILSLGKTNKSFLNIFASPKTVLDGAESTMRNNLKDYKLLEEFEIEVMTKLGRGIRFEYSAIDSDTKQFCEMTVVKYKNDFYVTYCHSRLADRKENEELFKTFHDSLKIS